MNDLKIGDKVVIVKVVTGAPDARVGETAVISRKGFVNYIWINLDKEQKEIACHKQRIKKIEQSSICG